MNCCTVCIILLVIILLLVVKLLVKKDEKLEMITSVIDNFEQVEGKEKKEETKKSFRRLQITNTSKDI